MLKVGDRVKIKPILNKSIFADNNKNREKYLGKVATITSVNTTLEMSCGIISFLHSFLKF
jgi:hypothetical protein